ncbi:MAG: hypothetical protein ACRECH_07260 [Nitrososphaerales archaeon]
MRRKNWALIILVFVPMAILPLSILFGELGIVQFTQPDGQPTFWGFLANGSITWTAIAVPLVLITYFSLSYRGIERSGLRVLILICVELVLYPVPYIFLAAQTYIPNSILWFYLSAVLTLFAGHAIKGQSNVAKVPQQIKKIAQEQTP